MSVNAICCANLHCELAAPQANTQTNQLGCPKRKPKAVPMTKPQGRKEGKLVGPFREQKRRAVLGANCMVVLGANSGGVSRTKSLGRSAD